jgi:hypothetical protein
MCQQSKDECCLRTGCVLERRKELLRLLHAEQHAPELRGVDPSRVDVQHPEVAMHNACAAIATIDDDPVEELAGGEMCAWRW